MQENKIKMQVKQTSGVQISFGRRGERLTVAAAEKIDQGICS